MCAVIDAANGYAYFGSCSNPGAVVKVALGTGNSTPIRVGSVLLNSMSLISGVIDAANGYAYFATDDSPVIVVKVALGTGNAAPTVVGSVVLNSGENQPWAAMIDAANGYAYFATYSSPGYVVKVALGAGNAAPTRVGAVMLNPGEIPRCAVIDPVNGYAYIGSQGTPGSVVKVALGANDALPTRVGAVTLNSGENDLVCAVIDAANGYAYFGTGSGNNDNSAGFVVKVALGAGTSAPIRVGSVRLNQSPSEPALCAVIDTVNSYAYFGSISTGVVAQVALGTGNAAPSIVSTTTLDPGAELHSAVIDPANGYAYIGKAEDPGVVFKVALPINNTVGQSSPAITSGSTYSFAIGSSGTFLVTTTGNPAPAISQGGDNLPSGLIFFDNGDGTGTLSGTPNSGTAGSYALTFTAANGVGTNAVQNFTLIVDVAAKVAPASNFGNVNRAIAYRCSWDRSKTNKDSMSIQATVEVGNLTVAAGTAVAFEIAGQRFTGMLSNKLDDHSNQNAKWVIKARGKGHPAGTVSVSLTVIRANLGAGFDESGAVMGQDPKATVNLNLPVILEIGGQAFELTVPSAFKFTRTGASARGSGKI